MGDEEMVEDVLPPEDEEAAVPAAEPVEDAEPVRGQPLDVLADLQKVNMDPLVGEIEMIHRYADSVAKINTHDRVRFSGAMKPAVTGALSEKLILLVSAATELTKLAKDVRETLALIRNTRPVSPK